MSTKAPKTYSSNSSLAGGHGTCTLTCTPPAETRAALSPAHSSAHSPAQTPQGEAKAAVGVKTDGDLPRGVQLTLQLYGAAQGTCGCVRHLKYNERSGQ